MPRIWKRVNGEEMKGDREMGQEVKQEAGDEEEKEGHADRRIKDGRRNGIVDEKWGGKRGMEKGKWIVYERYYERRRRGRSSCPCFCGELAFAFVVFWNECKGWFLV